MAETPKGQYQVILGTFINNEFIWHNVKQYDDLKAAYKGFKAYVNSQLKYTDEELKKVWDTGRLDVELRKGNKLLNWVGIYAREVDKLSQAEEEKADEDKPEKTKTKDAEPEENNDDHPLRVCEHCRAAIDAHEGPQFWKVRYVDDDEDIRCDWCDMETDKLYEIQ